MPSHLYRDFEALPETYVNPNFEVGIFEGAARSIARAVAQTERGFEGLKVAAGLGDERDLLRADAIATHKLGQNQQSDSTHGFDPLSLRWWVENTTGEVAMIAAQIGLSTLVPGSGIALRLGRVGSYIGRSLAFSSPTIIRSGGNTYVDAYKTWRIDRGATEAEAHKRAAAEAGVVAVISAMLEQGPFSQFVARVPNAGALLVSKLLRGGGIQKFMRKAAAGALSEGLEEVSQEFTQDLAQLLLRKDPEAFHEATQRYLTAGTIGAGIGGALGTITSADPLEQIEELADFSEVGDHFRRLHAEEQFVGQPQTAPAVGPAVTSLDPNQSPTIAPAASVAPAPTTGTIPGETQQEPVKSISEQDPDFQPKNERLTDDEIDAILEPELPDLSKEAEAKRRAKLDKLVERIDRADTKGVLKDPEFTGKHSALIDLIHKAISDPDADPDALAPAVTELERLIRNRKAKVRKRAQPETEIDAEAILQQESRALKLDEPARKALHRATRKFFGRGVQAIEDTESGVVVTTSNGKKIEIRAQGIILNEDGTSPTAQFEEGGNPELGTDALIRLSSETRGTTLPHEFLHSAMQFALTARERALLHRRFGLKRIDDALKTGNLDNVKRQLRRLGMARNLIEPETAGLDFEALQDPKARRIEAQRLAEEIIAERYGQLAAEDNLVQKIRSFALRMTEYLRDPEAAGVLQSLRKGDAYAQRPGAGRRQTRSRVRGQKTVEVTRRRIRDESGKIVGEPLGLVPMQVDPNPEEHFAVEMSPDEFLGLNPPRDLDTEQHRKLAEAIDSGKPIAPPFLNVARDANGNLRVTGHEGRGRASELKKRGVKKVEVDIFLKKGLRVQDLDSGPTVILRPDTEAGFGGRAVVTTRKTPVTRQQPRQVRASRIRSLVEGTRLTGGASVEAKTGDIPKTGFAVAPSKTTETKLNKLTFRDVRKFWQQNHKLLKQPGAILGAWLDADGVPTLDVAIVVSDKAEALRIAKEAEQDAIFDLENGREIRTDEGIKQLASEQGQAQASNQADRGVVDKKGRDRQAVSRQDPKRSGKQGPDRDGRRGLRSEPEPKRRAQLKTNKRIQDLATGFAKRAGISTYTPHQDYVEVDEARAKMIADAYDAMKHEPNRKEVKESYEAFAKETLKQYDYLRSRGIKMIPWGREGQPYANSAEVFEDISKNSRLFYFKTIADDGSDHFGSSDADHKGNPLVADANRPVKDSEGKVYRQTYNDLFRAVHDIFGHAQMGFQFGPRGEENAWISHVKMFSDLAAKAMTTETRGQNSWVNYGKHIRRADGSVPKRGDKDFAPLQDRPYADQKTGLLPPRLRRAQPRVATPVAATAIFNGAETVNVKKLARGGRAKADDIARALEKRTRKMIGGISDLSTEGYLKQRKKIVRRATEIMTEDLRLGISMTPQGRSGVGWYDTAISEMMDELVELHPELKTSKPHAALFKIINAVTSNGSKVEDNLNIAEAAYAEWKRTGRIPPVNPFTAPADARTLEVRDGVFGSVGPVKKKNKKTGKVTVKMEFKAAPKGHNLDESLLGKALWTGERGWTVKAHLEMIQDLVDRHGLDGIEAYLLKPMTVREVRKDTGQAVSGEDPELQARRAVMFGPKLGAFFMNQMGLHEFLTMDKWFTRTWNRIVGNFEWRPKVDKETGETKMVMKDAPKSPVERRIMREAVDAVVKLSNEGKIEGVPKGLTVDDVQAVLWYVEQGLYQKLGFTPGRTESIDYAEAARRVKSRRAKGVRFSEASQRQSAGDAGQGGRAEPRSDSEVQAKTAKGNRAQPSLSKAKANAALAAKRQEVKTLKATVSAQKAAAKRAAIRFAADRVEAILKRVRAKQSSATDAITAIAELVSKLPKELRGKFIQDIRDVQKLSTTGSDKVFNAALDRRLNATMQKVIGVLRSEARKREIKTLKALVSSKRIKRDKRGNVMMSPEISEVLTPLVRSVRKGRISGTQKLADLLRDWDHNQTEDVVLTPAQISSFLKLEGKLLNDKGLHADALASLQDAIKFVTAVHQSRETAKILNQKVALRDLRDRLVAELSKRKAIAMKDELGRTPKRGYISRLLTEGLLKPDLYAEVQSGSDQSEWHKVMYQNLKSSRRAWLAEHQRAEAYLRQKLESLGFKWGSKELTEMSDVASGQVTRTEAALKRDLKSVGKSKAKIIEVKLPSGKTVSMTKAERIDLLAHLTDSETRADLVAGRGLRFARRTEGDVIKLDAADVAALEASATVEERKLAEALMQYVNTVIRDGINNWSVRAKGHRIALREDYWPRTVDSKSLDLDRVGLSSRFSKTALTAMGFIQQREIGSDKPILISDALAKFSNHAWRAGGLIHFEEASRTARQLINDDKIASTINARFGKVGTSYWQNLVDELVYQAAGNPNFYGGFVNEIASGIMNNAIRGVLGLNPGVALKQVVSVLQASVEMPGKFLRAALGKTGVMNFRSTKLDDEMMRYSPEINARYTTSALHLVTSVPSSKPANVLGRKNLGEKWMAWITAMDRIAVRTIWEASKMRIASEQPGLKQGSTEYWNAVALEAERVINRTQPNFDLMDQPQLGIESRRNTVAKLIATMFYSQRSQNYQMLWRATRKYRAGKKAVALRQMAVTAVAAPIALLAIDAVTRAILGGGPKEDEEDDKWLLSKITDIVEVNAGNVALFDNAFSIIRQKISDPNREAFREDNLVTSIVHDTYTGIARMFRGVTGQAKDNGKEFLRGAEQAGFAIAKGGYGLPTRIPQAIVRKLREEE